MNSIQDFLRLTVLIGLVASAQAQEVNIPDPGLNAAIRDALQKPTGPLTVPDLLSLTNLDARESGVQSLDGLGAASNLAILHLSYNELKSLTVPSGLTNLHTLNFAYNELTNFT